MINEGILHSDNDLEKNPVQPEINGEVYNIELEENKLNKENFAIKKEKIKEVEKKTSGENLVTFHEVSYSVEIKRKGVCCGKTKKIIIDKISGFFQQGMNAIMGPTGGGKSSLLDILAGRKDPKGLEGLVLVDGKKQPHDFNRKTAYVIQEDIVMGTLTVKENIMFSANLRLPKSLGHKEKSKRVEEIIRDLGLEKCANTKVGTQFIRGVSGGEKKRTNIAMEMIISPNILFLDEPTTGLDSFTSNSIMSLLHSLSLDGRTIIFSIHQPRYSIFKYFHRLMLLSEGKTVYHGPAIESLDFFSKIGFRCEEHNNPADFFLDVIKGAEGQEHKDFDENNENLKKNNNDQTTLLASKFIESEWFQKLESTLVPISAQVSPKDSQFSSISFFRDSYTTNFFSQFHYLSRRAIKNIVRNPMALIIQLVVSTAFSTIIGLIFLQINRKDTSNYVTINNITGALFFLTVNQMFASLSSAELFINERTLFIHENSHGYYRTSAYFAAKIFCDIIPTRLPPITIYSIISYFMIGFGITANQFFIYYFGLIMVSLTATSLCFLVSSSVAMPSIASLLISFNFVVSLLFGGFLSNLKFMGDWLNWISYFSLVRYGLRIQFINQLKNLDIMIPNKNMTYIGRETLNELGMKHETNFDLWSNFLALAIYSLIILFITYFKLRKFKKTK